MGTANHQFRHGRYSKHLPRVFGDWFREAYADPEVLSLRRDVALTDARVCQLLERLHSGESGGQWARLKETWAGLLAARDAADGPGMASAMGEIGKLIMAGAGQEEVWRELYATIDRKAKLSAREWKRQADLQQMIPAEQAMALVAAIVHVVKRNVHDAATLQAISREVSGLLTDAHRGG